MVVASVERRGECAICAAADAAALATRSGPVPIAVYADDEVIAFVEPGVPGALVAPRTHAGPLSTTADCCATVLAPLRRAGVAVQAFYDGSGVVVQPASDFPGASGHACFRVLPTLPARQGALSAFVHVLVSALQGVLAP